MNGEASTGPALPPGGLPRVARRTVVISNPQGLHLRPAASFAKRARQFAGRVNVIREGMSVNGKSQVELLLLAAEPGTELVVEVDGQDADRALTLLIEALSAEYSDEEE